jgi:hypothetical protein
VFEESRILQVGIFNTLQNNLDRVDFSQLLRDVITVTEEVESQLKQAIRGYADCHVGGLTREPNSNDVHSSAQSWQTCDNSKVTFLGC